ncbi:MAG: aminotransferase class I/II-fold pyridoxal phosphate-dependent enzyme [Deltaproteobacteria bacterium]|nr:aminotransferase class I/II-fold pyridoxal phosphate-dependent enzyme [Deltaproteobacteria bacterium]
MTRVCEAAGGLNLAQGFPDFEAPAQIKAAAKKAIDQDLNQYAITHGEPVLRQALARKVADYNKMEIDPETEITVTCGPTEAMMATMLAVINPGDEVVIFEPFYENYGPDAILSGARPRYVTLHPPDWGYDPQELAAAFGDKTKAVIINTPHNPTGKVFSLAELTEIAELCRKWNCLAVTDEIYEHILYDGAEHISIASLEGMAHRTVTINAISKTYSLTGWRVGWAMASPQISDRIRRVHDFLTVGSARPLQVAAATALGLPPDYYRGLAQRYLQARDFLFEALDKVGLQPNLPRGAYYIICQVDDLKDKLGASNDTDFCQRLIEVCGVAAVPGSSFYATGQPGQNQIRFCFCKRLKTLLSVAQRLQALNRL